MSEPKKLKRMQRSHDRAKKLPPFNIVSLMDIFTILVFFLLVNASDPSVLPNAKGIVMPESIAEKKPRVSVVLMLSAEDIKLQGNSVVESEALSDNQKADIEKLQLALQTEAQKIIIDEESEQKKEITIMGDKEVPFSLIKRVMQICSSAGFEQISLSVIQKDLQTS
ncbi:MAG: biopolymer transporter ExbD [Pseudomonadota bacterium]